MLIVSCEKGPGILECDEQKKGLLPRVVDGIFECIKSSEEPTKYSVKLSMVMRIADLRLFSYWSVVICLVSVSHEYSILVVSLQVEIYMERVRYIIYITGATLHLFNYLLSCNLLDIEDRGR